jgi:hypothetical protein
VITKLVFCVRKRADLSVEEFCDYWLNGHGPLVRSLWEAGSFPGMLKYVQSHTIHEADGGRSARGTLPPYDGITEVWMDSELGATDDSTRAASAAAGKRLLEDESTFIDFAGSCVFVTTEHVIFE